MVEAGGCSYVQKTRNVFNANAKAAIIIDRHHDTESKNEAILGDDGSGAGIKIPSILIDSHSGDRLINYYNKMHGIHATNTGHVINLNEENFEVNVYGGDEAWIIEFYHPDCPHCRYFAPHYETISAKLCPQLD